MLGQTRLVTLTGPGGVGKTRLALEVAREVVDDYPDGVWLVELAALADPALVPRTVAYTFGVREWAGEPLIDTLAAWLADKHLLVVLDNCEHLIEVCAYLADALLRHCPQFHLLATSREPLGISGETTWRVPVLGLPDLTAQRPEEVALAAAACLFVERARAVQPCTGYLDHPRGPRPCRMV